MLTQEQHEQRSRGIGASDVPAIIGVQNPGGRTIVDVWARKWRGPQLSRKPLVDTSKENEPETCDAFAPFIRGDARTAGSVLEDGIAELYEMMTGLTLFRSRTHQHPQHAWALATADRLVAASPSATIDRGLEIKLVGEKQAMRAWPDDGIADHVFVQVQWCMFVYDLGRWDVCALVGGSAPRIVRVERDEEFIADCADVVGEFWHEHVLADAPPPPPTAAAAMALARSIWRRDDGSESEAPTEALRFAAELVQIQAEKKAIEERERTAKAALAVMTAGHKRIYGPWGAFNHATKQGQVSWKEVAIELAGGAVPHELIERHRGEPSRSATLYPNKRWAARLLASKNTEALPEETGDTEP